MIDYTNSLETANLFPTRDARSKSLKAIGIRPKGQYGMGATAGTAIQGAGAALLESIKAELMIVSPDEMSKLRADASNGDALAKIRIERLQQEDQDAEEAIARDKAAIAHDIEKYKTPYTFGVAEGRVGE